MAPKVILISLDGATDTIVDKYLQNGVLSSKTGLGLLKSKGLSATTNETVTPSLTAAAHIAIATGSTAVNNDINANSFHLIANPFTTNTSGFAAPIGGYNYQSGIDPSESSNPTANPLWLAIRNAGKTVVAATFPGADGANIKSSTGIILDKASDRTVNYTIPFGTFGGVGGKGFSLTSSDFTVNSAQAVTGLNALSKTFYGSVKVANLETIAAMALSGGSTSAYNLQVAAIDTTNDNTVNYDTLVVFDANVGIKGASSLPSTGSAFIKVSDQKSSSFYFDGSNNKVVTAFYGSTLAADLSKVNLARYSAYYIPRPAESPAVIANVDDINSNIGSWAPQADFRFPERINTGLTQFSDAELEAIYADQVKTFVDYQTKVLLRSIQQNPNADLVLGYIEQPDGSEHQFLLNDPRQATDFTNPNSIGAGQDAAKVARYQKYVETAYQLASDAVQKVIDSVGVDANGKPNSNIIVVSDHGFTPFHTAVSMNNLLKNAGFDSNKVRAVTSGPSVNVYINLKGREPAVAGVTQVEVAEYLTLQKQVQDLLKAYADSNANYTNGAATVNVFDKIYTRQVPATATTANEVINARGAFIGEDTGDVFALLTTGYNFDGVQSATTPVIRKGDTFAQATAVLSVPNFYGAHGYDPTLPDMKAIFYAAGPDVTPKVLGSVNNIDIAPTIEKILGVTPASTVNGKAIDLTAPAFPNGVASGDTTQTSAVLWTRSRFTGAVKFEYSTKADFSTIAGTKTATVTNNPLQPVKVDVTGLTAGTDYFYRVTDAAGASATGKFSTAEAIGKQAGLKFGVAGDWRGELAPYPAISNVPSRNLKFFVELGDTIYGDVASPALKNPNGTEKQQAITIDDYRTKYDEVYGSRYGLNTFADLRASTSIIATIDDHEVYNDFAGGSPIKTYQSTLTSTQEVVASTATSASGTGIVELLPSGNAIAFSLTIKGLDFGSFLGFANQTATTADDVILAHIHQGNRGANGPVVFDIKDDADRKYTLNADGSVTITGRWDSTDAKPISQTVIDSLKATASGSDSGFYFNVHTTANAGGAIRGQIAATTTLVNDTFLFENGLQAFQEYKPIQDQFYGATGDVKTAGERKVYRANTYGSDAINIVLDARSFRDTELAGITNLADQVQVGTFLAKSFDPSRTLLGRIQVEDLKRDLLQAQKDGVTWKFVNIPEPIQNLGVLAASDRYEGYAAERTEILRFINENKINNVVFIAADIHGTVVNNLTYQLGVGQPQIFTNAFEITTGSVAYDAPFGPTVADLALGVGLLTPAQKAFYDSLPVANDADNISNDKDDFIKSIVDGGLSPLGYDPVGLNNNLTQANGLIKAKLLQGDYVATQTYGWTEFNIDPTTQKLTVTTYGIPFYTRAELEANPSDITSRQPKIVSQFEVEANTVVAEAKLVTSGTSANDDLVALNGATFDGRSNIAFTGAGNDKVDFGFNTSFAVGNNRIDLGSGNDNIFVSQNDRVFGGDGNDIFEATEGKGGNRMSGGAGDDTFFLGANDRALGGDGNDKFFVGTGGGNLLSGSAGADQFWIATGGTLPTGVNTVLDFTTGTDVIGFLGFGAAFNFGSLSFANNDIKVGNAVIATLTGVTTSSLTATNFAFA